MTADELTAYVFGPNRRDGILIHKRTCSHLDTDASYRECPPQVAALVTAIWVDYPYGQVRKVGLCGDCLR